MVKKFFSVNRWRTKRRERHNLNSESLRNSNETSAAGAPRVDSSPSNTWLSINNLQSLSQYSSWSNEPVSDSRLNSLYNKVYHI